MSDPVDWVVGMVDSVTAGAGVVCEDGVCSDSDND